MFLQNIGKKEKVSETFPSYLEDQFGRSMKRNEPVEKSIGAIIEEGRL